MCSESRVTIRFADYLLDMFPELEKVTNYAYDVVGRWEGWER